MAEDIKELIEKIQQDGINAAEEKARQVEERAKGQVAAILQKAKLDADKMLAEARASISKMQAAADASLKQAGRNLLLSLKKEINAMLDTIAAKAVKQALTPDELAKILAALIKESARQEKADIVVLLNKDDLHSLEKGFLSELQGQVKKGITVKPQEDISAGFVISYDSGKSHFDFTDKALAEYLSRYLKPRLAEILKH